MIKLFKVDLPSKDFGCRAGHENGFARGICSLMEDEALRLRWASAAREKSEKYYSLDRLAADVFRAYE